MFLPELECMVIGQNETTYAYTLLLPTTFCSDLSYITFPSKKIFLEEAKIKLKTGFGAKGKVLNGSKS